MKRRGLLSALGLTGLLGSPALAQVLALLRVGVMSNDPEAWAAAQVLAQVYKQAGLTPSFVSLPPARATIALAAGDVDADLMRIARFGVLNPQLLRVPTPLYRLRVVVASLPSRHIVVRKREDLAGRTVGAVHGYYYVQELTEGLAKVMLAQGTEQVCRMLKAGRVDLALDTELSMRHTLGRLGMRDVEISPPLMTLELYHYLDPHLAALVAPIDEALRTMTARGELARLAQQFEAQAVHMRVDQFY